MTLGKKSKSGGQSRFGLRVRLVVVGLAAVSALCVLAGLALNLYAGGGHNHHPPSKHDDARCIAPGDDSETSDNDNKNNDNNGTRSRIGRIENSSGNNENNSGNDCRDNPCFRHRDREDRTCDWIGTNAHQKRRLCNDTAIEKECPIVCDAERCREEVQKTKGEGEEKIEETETSIETDAPSSVAPTGSPTSKPTSQRPTISPSQSPTGSPTSSPTSRPSQSPTNKPTNRPSQSPTDKPTNRPSQNPTDRPTGRPTSDQPTALRAYPRGKKGACFTLRDEGSHGSYAENLPKLLALLPDWAYSWSDVPAEGVPLVFSAGGGVEIPLAGGGGGVDFVPMLWGYYPGASFETSTDRILAQNPRIVLGFNEPDSPEQADIPDVETAVTGWRELVSKMGGDHGVDDGDDDASDKSEAWSGVFTRALRPRENNDDDDGLLFVSPACVHPLGDWCWSFMQQTGREGLRVDAIGVHYYGSSDPEDFFDLLEDVYESYGRRPLLVTEFALADWDAATPADNKYGPGDAMEFMRAVLPWLESKEWVLGYSWFSFERDDPNGWVSALFEAETESGREHNVFDKNSNSNNDAPELTPLGRYYANFRSDRNNDKRGEKEKHWNLFWRRLPWSTETVSTVTTTNLIML